MRKKNGEISSFVAVGGFTGGGNKTNCGCFFAKPQLLGEHSKILCYKGNEIKGFAPRSAMVISAPVLGKK